MSMNRRHEDHGLTQKLQLKGCPTMDPAVQAVHTSRPSIRYQEVVVAVEAVPSVTPA